MSKESLELEKGNKHLRELHVQKYYDILNERDNYHDSNDEDSNDEESRPEFLANIRRQKNVNKKREETLEEIQMKKQKREYEIRIQKEIRVSIQKFVDAHPYDLEDLQKLWHETKKTRKFLSWAESTRLYGGHFRTKKRIDDANYFYNLSTKSEGDHNNSFFEQGDMNRELFNDEIRVTKPKRPTSSLCYHIMQAVNGFSLASNDVVDVGLLEDSIKLRDMYVRWNMNFHALEGPRDSILFNMVYAVVL